MSKNLEQDLDCLVLVTLVPITAQQVDHESDGSFIEKQKLVLFNGKALQTAVNNSFLWTKS
jgi:hypothetical protein